MTSDELAKINTKLEDYTIEGELARTVKANIVRLQTIGAYRGMRHTRNLPARGKEPEQTHEPKEVKERPLAPLRKKFLASLKPAKRRRRNKKYGKKNSRDRKNVYFRLFQ